MAQGKLFYVMQTIFCIWMAQSQILTSTCLNCLKYMIILASSDRKQYQYFHKFFHCASDQLVPVYFTLSCIMLLLVSWRITFSRGTSMRSRLQWDARPCTFTRIQSHPLTLMRTHIHTQKTPVALCTSLSGVGDVSPALVLSREIARPQTSACSLKLWVPPS